MALEVASILDELALRPEWVAKSCATLNTDLSKIKTKPGYDIMVTIAGRNYYLSSDESGTLTVRALASGQQSTKALARCKCRLVIPEAALSDFDEAKKTSMSETRKMWYEGDTTLFNNLNAELAPHLNRLRDNVEAAGPGQHAVQAAIDEHNLQIADSKAELAAYGGRGLDLGLQPGDDVPVIMKCGSWLLFSAGSTMFGNVGQSNYCAANCLLDAQTFSYRQTNYDNFEALTIMWGAVVGLGMRWKAFASQDFLGGTPMTFDYREAQLTLKMMMTVGPEWVTIMRGMDPERDYNQPTRSFRAPWDKSKGAGGGVSLNPPPEPAPEPAPTAAPQEKQREWLFPGRRVRVQGLVNNAEMNGLKGTLVEQVRPGVWHVDLEDGFGGKLLKEENMAQVHCSRFTGEQTTKEPATISEAEEAKDDTPPEPMCIAGNWDGWMPHDMEWDGAQKCYTFSVELGGHQATSFGVNRGKAATKPWKPAIRAATKKWNVGQAEGPHQIKVFVKDSKVSAAEWAPRA